MSTNFISYMNSAAEQYGIKLSDMQLAQFDKYFQMLIEWNEKINLTAITDPQEVAVKHMIDSLSAWRADIFKPGAFVIDVGTGAGFPGIPLKIFQPDIKLTLYISLISDHYFYLVLHFSCQLWQIKYRSHLLIIYIVSFKQIIKGNTGLYWSETIVF